MEQERRCTATDDIAFKVTDVALAVGDLATNSGDFPAERVLLPALGSAHELRLHFNSGLRAILMIQGRIDGEINDGVEQDGLHAALNTAVRVAGELRRVELALSPSEIFTVDSVGGDFRPDGINNGHSAIAEPSVHVLSGVAHPRDDSFR